MCAATTPAIGEPSLDTAQVEEHGSRVSIPTRGIRLERTIEYGEEIEREPCATRIARVLPPPAQQHLAEHDPRREHVRTRGRTTGRLLGGHVPGGAGSITLHGSAPPTRGPEVGQRDTVVRQEDQVLRLDVAVQHVMRVSMCESEEQLPGVPQRPRDGDGSAEPLRQRPPPERRDQDWKAAGDVEVEHTQHVGMPKLAVLLGLVAKVLDELGVGVARGRDLERHGSMPAGIEAAVDLGEATDADLTADAVAADSLAVPQADHGFMMIRLVDARRVVRPARAR